jgi:hypothetical protein
LIDCGGGWVNPLLTLWILVVNELRVLNLEAVAQYDGADQAGMAKVSSFFFR